MEITPLISKDFLVVQDEAPLSELIGKMKQYEKHSIFVFRKDKYVGMIDKKKVLRSRVDASEMKIKFFIQKTPVISEHEDIVSAAYLMYQSNAEVVPIQRDKTIVGALRSIDLAKGAADLPETKGLKITDFKLLRPSKINKNDPITTAMEIMHDERVDQVPLFENGKLYGIISYKDILRKYLNWSPKREFSTKFTKAISSKGGSGDSQHLGLLPVSSCSTNDNLVTVTTQHSLGDAAMLMLKNNILDVLVMAQDEFKGILTVKNILARVGSLKIPENYNIQFVGLNKAALESYQKANVQKICSNEALKIQRMIKNEFTLVVHIKEYGKDARQRKYSIHLRVEYPGHIITASADDWDIETAVHKTFENAKNEAKRMFQGDTSKKFIKKGRV